MTISYYKPSEIIIENNEVNAHLPIHVLCVPPMHFLPALRADLERHFHVSYAYNLPRDKVLEKARTAEALIANPGATYSIDANFLKEAKNLKFIVTPSTGSDHIDRAYCDAHNIIWKALKGTGPIVDSIYASAEFSFALLMAMIRNLPRAVYAAREGYWRTVEDDFRGIELNKKKVGIIGYGRIGHRMSRYSHAFEAEVRAFDPYLKVKDAWVTQVSRLEEILEWADIVCVHVHLNDETRKMFGAREFKIMKPGSYFLNTARGAVVDENALVEAVDSGHLKGAAVDVIEGEQSESVMESPLIQLARRSPDKMIVAPHIAGLTVDSQGKATRFAVDEVKKYFCK